MPLPHRLHPGQRLAVADHVAKVVSQRLQLRDRLNDRVVDRRHVAGLEPSVDVEVFRVELLMPALPAVGEPDGQDFRDGACPVDQLKPANRSRARITGGVQCSSSESGRLHAARWTDRTR